MGPAVVQRVQAVPRKHLLDRKAILIVHEVKVATASTESRLRCRRLPEIQVELSMPATTLLRSLG